MKRGWAILIAGITCVASAALAAFSWLIAGIGCREVAEGRVNGNPTEDADVVAVVFAMIAALPTGYSIATGCAFVNLLLEEIGDGISTAQSFSNSR